MRWIPFSRVSMQRAGLLVAIVAAATDSRPTNLEGIARAYADLLRRKRPLPSELEQRVNDYLRQQRLWKRYGKKAVLTPGTPVEAQDLWLSDLRLPSSSGAVTDEVVDEPPQLASALQLVRPHNYTLTDRGRALRSLAAPEVGALADGLLDPNPFVVRAGAAAILIYTLLDSDFDFVREAYRAALDKEGTAFTRASFASALPAACRALYERAKKATISGEELRQLARLKELEELISRERKSGKEWGGGRPPDQTATLRIEPYVDLGIVTKDKRSEYEYSLSPRQQSFFKSLLSAKDATEFLDDDLFGAYVAVLQDGSSDRIGDDEIWTRIKRSYGRLRSGLGYAALREVVLLAACEVIEETKDRYFEVSDGIRVVKEWQQRDPRAVRFGVGREGKNSYVKLQNEHAIA